MAVGERVWESWKRDRSVLQVAGRSRTEVAGSQSVPRGCRLRRIPRYLRRYLRDCSLRRLGLGKSRTTMLLEFSRSHSPAPTSPRGWGGWGHTPPNPQALLSSQESKSFYLLSKDTIPHPGAYGPLAACPPPGSYLSLSLILAPVIPLVFLHPRH